MIYDNRGMAGPSFITARLAAFARRSEAVRGYALLAPTMLIMLAALAAPLVLLALYSFWTQDGFTVDTHFTLAQYANSFGRETYRAAVLPLAVDFRGRDAGDGGARLSDGLFRRVSRGAQQIRLAHPSDHSVLDKLSLRVFAWKMILGYNGVINSGLMALGLIHQPLEFLLYNPTAVVVTLAHAWAAFAILPIYVSLEKIDRSLLEAAADLGDGPVRRFFRITLPLSLPGVIGAAVLIFVPTTGDYVTPSLVGGTRGRDDRQCHRGAIRARSETGRWAPHSPSPAWRRWASSTLLFGAGDPRSRFRGSR